MLGVRTLCDNYESVLLLKSCNQIRIADMSCGKAHDDGYRGVHVYYQLDNFHYPIEIQYNTYYDRQMNNWLHKYIYKKSYNNSIGQQLRHVYENAEIRNENEFRERLKNVLLDCKKIDDTGCLALQTTHGSHLADFKERLIQEIGYEQIQLVTISRPSAYGEYEPYHFVDTEQEFEQAVKNM